MHGRWDRDPVEEVGPFALRQAALGGLGALAGLLLEVSDRLDHQRLQGIALAFGLRPLARQPQVGDLGIAITAGMNREETPPLAPAP